MSSITENILDGVSSVVYDAVVYTVYTLSTLYEFSESDAMERLNVTLKKDSPKVSKKTKKQTIKPSMPLPFCGSINEETCYGIKYNHGLHTQCTNTKNGLSEYCKTCEKQTEKNANGKPNCGDIRDRLTCGLLEFRDPKGRETISYGTLIQKLGLDKDAAMREASKFDITIPEEHWNVVKKSRGRPKKVVEVSDTDSDVPKKKGRGRPKKVKDIVSSVSGDLLAQLRAATLDDDTSSEKSSDVSSETSNQNNDEEKAESVKESVSDNNSTNESEDVIVNESVVSKLSEKESKAAAKLAEKEAKAAAKLAEKEAKAAAKKAEKEAKAAAKLAEKEAKAAAKKAEKEAKAAAKKTVKEEAEITTNKTNNAPISPLSQPETQCQEQDEEEEAIPFEFEGKTYLKTEDNLIYTMESVEDDNPEPIGMWNPETNTIMEISFMSDDEEE